MELFPLRLLPTLPRDDAQLYYRADGAVTQTPDGLRLAAGAALTLDTYHNCFSFAKYRDYTVAAHCGLRLHLRGDCTAQLLVCRPAENGAAADAPLSAPLSHTGTDDLLLCWDNAALSGEGFLYLRLCAAGDCLLRGGSFFTDDAPLREVSLGVLICTYKREEYVRETLARLTAYAENLPVAAQLHVYVSDNGGTLPRADCANDRVTVVVNENLGGSGGFARCLLEAADGGHSHVLFMDDDIVFDCAVLTKTISFLRLAAPGHENLCLGGSMQLLDTPYRQQEAGAFCKNLAVCGVNMQLDLRPRESLLCNELGSGATYQAWWYCCLPYTPDLPFPFFIKFDDVEYGIRRGAEVLVLNGVSVAHESFEGKATELLCYYDWRNTLTAFALFGQPASRRELLHRVWYWLPRRIGTQRYECAENCLDALRDYLGGPRFYARTDAAALHRTLMQRGPALRPAAELEAETPQQIPRVRQFWEARSQCRGHRRLLHINEEAQRGYLSRRSLPRALRLGGRLLLCSLRILFFAGAAARAYRRDAAALTSRAAWEARLHLTQK